ncbi:unnamed protein product [Acanthosepion pharaonis]|uniref:Uncharacterized protein n=1 Tax=Acanthosepion pharaonis TaxID=158019 RepID=A0A812BAP3_ACAPH|nr:unnamed protein product [Sepia pharaonis]
MYLLLHSFFFFKDSFFLSFRRFLSAFSFSSGDSSSPPPEIPHRLFLPFRRFLFAFPFLNPLFFFSNSVFFVFSLHLIFLFIVFVFSFKCFRSLICLYVSTSLFILCFRKQQQCSGYFPFSSSPFAPFYLHFVSILPASVSFYLLNHLRNGL